MLDGGLLNSNAPASDVLDFSALAAGVSVDLALAAVTGVVNEFSRIERIQGSAGIDTLLGPGAAGDDVAWSIDGADTGTVSNIEFAGFENLTGQNGTNDAFSFGPLGSLFGTLDGGTGIGTQDGLSVNDGTTTIVILPLSPGPESVAVDGRTIDYVGMESLTPLSGDAANRVINGSIFGDTIVLEDDTTTAGQMRVTFVGLSFFNGIGYDTGFVFANPTESLSIIAGAGGDTITVLSVDDAFAADLLLYGNGPGAPSPEPDAAHDVIVFAGDVYTRGGYLEAFGDDISVAAGVTLSTLIDENDLSSGDDIVFRARRIGTPDFENTLPSGYLSKSVTIDIGDNATLLAANIFFVAQAEDRSLADQLGLTTLQSSIRRPVS